MTDLLTHLTKAKKGNRGLDARLAVYSGDIIMYHRSNGFAFFEPPVRTGNYAFLSCPDTSEDMAYQSLSRCLNLKAYTTSLDAITGLMAEKLPGWTWDVDNDGYVQMWNGEMGTKSREVICKEGKPPALALCIAFVKAMEGKEG